MRVDNIQVEASMCHLRGILMLKLNRTARAKDCFMEALALDVKCYDAFEMLIGGELMTIDEGQFLEGFQRLQVSETYKCRMGFYSSTVIQGTCSFGSRICEAGLHHQT